MLGKSPAQLFFNRRLKTDLPTASPLLESNSVGMQDIQERLKTRKFQQKINYDAHVGKELRDLFTGESTVMRHDNKWTPAVIVQQHSSPRSYILQTQSGKRYRRNIRHIRPTSATFHDKPEVGDTVIPLPSEKTDTPCRSNTVQSQIEKPPQEVEPANIPISVPSTTCTRSGRSVLCPSKFKDFVKFWNDLYTSKVSFCNTSSITMVVLYTCMWMLYGGTLMYQILHKLQFDKFYLLHT